jgi:hypothetical protein
VSGFFVIIAVVVVVCPADLALTSAAHRGVSFYGDEDMPEDEKSGATNDDTSTHGEKKRGKKARKGATHDTRHTTQDTAKAGSSRA